ncbi:MAG: cation diffusion facilitator family transporter [Lachnospiraceae bacterium]|nr:cation diffusion facilitator family transporter [Lachnospiraceae bacterium]
MEEKTFLHQATKVSLVSIIGNLVLSLLKLLAGIIASSGAMISDAVHSASDVFSSIIVIIGVRISSKESDKEHPYGHERLECVAAIVLATVLAVTGLGIGYLALQKIIRGNYDELKVPGMLALIAAAVSIVTKEAMFWYTRWYAKRLDSPAIMADAWHHRSDALSSVGALIGIGGAMLGYPIMEPVASLIICGFICKAAFDIFKDATDKMVDKSCDEAFENEIKEIVYKQEGVLGIDLLQTRMFGNKIYVDIEIAADGEKTLNETHDIAERVHDVLEETYPKIKHIMVHVNPLEGQK